MGQYEYARGVFIGHYAPALALKPIARRVPLWVLFVAVQLLDFGWDAFVFVGIEHVRITPGFTASNDYELYDMPWTHSLVAALAWSIAAALVTRRLAPGNATDARVGALVVGVAVFSHWALDALVHASDLSIAGPGTPYVGLGLWNYPILQTSLEVGLVIAGGLLAARGHGPAARPVLALTAVLVVVAIVERLVPPPASVMQLVISAFAAYVAFALAAWRVDRAGQSQSRSGV